MKFDNTLNRLRSIGILEAISYLLLLGIAMPLKYAFDMPLAVRVVGMAHGLLWILYVGLIGLAQMDYKWSFKNSCWLFIGSLLPFGPFIADNKILRPFETKTET